MAKITVRMPKTADYKFSIFGGISFSNPAVVPQEAIIRVPHKHKHKRKNSNYKKSPSVVRPSRKPEKNLAAAIMHETLKASKQITGVTGSQKMKKAMTIATAKSMPDIEMKTPRVVSDDIRRYRKAYKNLKKRYRNALARGYQFPDWTPPKRVKSGEITHKYVEEFMSKYAGDKFYQYGFWVDTKTGEAIEGDRKRKMERQTAYNKGVATKAGLPYVPEAKEFTSPTEINQIIDHVIDILDHYEPENYWSEMRIEIVDKRVRTMRAMLHDAIDQHGRDAVAAHLMKYGERLHQITVGSIWPSDAEELEQNYVEFATIMNFDTLSMEEAQYYQDLMEAEEDYGG